MPAPTNATVTLVLSPGGLDEYGDATTGAVAWQGRLDGYLRRPRLSGHVGIKTGAGSSSTDRESAPRIDELIVHGSVPGALVFFDTLRCGEAGEAARVTVEDRLTGTLVERTNELVGVDGRIAGTSVYSVRVTLRREA